MTQGIRRQDFISRLLAAVPDFEADSGNVEDGLTFFIANDLARYMCSKSQSHADLSLSASFVETCLLDGTEEVRDLAHEVFEALLDDAACNANAKIRPALLQNSKIWFDWIKENGFKVGAGPRPEITRLGEIS